MAVGFSNEPEKIDESWTREHRGRIYTFTKTKKGKHHFIYNCSLHVEDKTVTQDSSTGYLSDHELSRDEIEKRPQFCGVHGGQAMNRKGYIRRWGKRRTIGTRSTTTSLRTLIMRLRGSWQDQA